MSSPYEGKHFFVSEDFLEHALIFFSEDTVILWRELEKKIGANVGKGSFLVSLMLFRRVSGEGCTYRHKLQNNHSPVFATSMSYLYTRCHMTFIA